MPYAVLQTELGKPTIEQMGRAFRSVPGLTPTDAHILGNDAFGILVKNFSEIQAAAMQGALRTEGVETEVVDQALLPTLPQTHFVARLDCTPEHLLIYDPMNRSFPLDWRHVALIAAGAVRVTEFVRRESKQDKVRFTGGGLPYMEAEYNSTSREEQNFHLLGEIIITGGALRYSFTADKLNFAYLGERRTKNNAQNFTLLVRDLAQFAANAALNLGAEAMAGASSSFTSYPSKNAFYEEIIWTLWQMRKAA